MRKILFSFLLASFASAESLEEMHFIVEKRHPSTGTSSLELNCEKGSLRCEGRKVRRGVTLYEKTFERQAVVEWTRALTEAVQALKLPSREPAHFHGAVWRFRLGELQWSGDLTLFGKARSLENLLTSKLRWD